MSLKVISHLVLWPALLVVGGVLLFTPRDILRQPVLASAESPRTVGTVRAPAPAAPVVEVMPATLTITYLSTGPVNGPSNDVAALEISAPPGGAVRADPAAPPVDRRWITAQGLNVRTGPSVEASHIASLPFGTMVEVIEVSGNWAHVEAGDITGWLSTRFLTSEKPAD